MINGKRIAVVMPAYNAAKTLEKTAKEARALLGPKQKPTQESGWDIESGEQHLAPALSAVSAGFGVPGGHPTT